jgi:hypothetical protein
MRPVSPPDSSQWATRRACAQRRANAVELAIDPDQNVVIGHKLAQRASDKQLHLIPILPPEHLHHPGSASAVIRASSNRQRPQRPFQ